MAQVEITKCQQVLTFIPLNEQTEPCRDNIYVRHARVIFTCTNDIVLLVRRVIDTFTGKLYHKEEGGAGKSYRSCPGLGLDTWVDGIYSK